VRVVAVLLFTLAASAQPFPVSPSVELGAAPGERTGIALATNGDNVLAVWQDSRGGTAVRGSFLDRSGRPVADRDFLISTHITSSDTVRPQRADRPHLAVASDGDGYLVAHAGVQGGNQSRTYFTRVTAAGAVEAGPDFVDGTVRSMVYAGGHYIVATIPNEPAWRPRLAVVDRTGHVVRENLHALSAAEEYAFDATLLATRRGELLIAWEPWTRSFLGITLMNPADLLDPAYDGARGTTRLDTMGFDPITMAEGDDGFLIASMNPVCWYQGLSLVILGPDGAVRKREDLGDQVHSFVGKLTAVRERDGYILFADVLLGYGEPVTAGTMRITASGERPFGGFRRFGGAVPESMAALSGPGRLLWASIAGNRAQVAGLAFVNNGSLVTENDALLSRSHPAQDSSATARCGDTNVVAWRDRWTGSAVARLRRFSSSGQPLDPPNRALGRLPMINDGQPGLTIACGKTTALIAWREASFQQNEAKVHGVLLHADGSLLDLGVMPNAKLFRVTFDGSSYVIVSNGYRSWWQRWTEQGTRITQVQMPELDGKRITELELASNGSGLMAVWLEDELVDKNLLTRVRAREFRPNFQPNGPELTMAPEVTALDVTEHLALGSRPGQWLALWREYRGVPDWRVQGSPIYGPAITAFNGVTPLQLSWNGTAWELLDRYGVGLLDQNGRALAYHRLLDRAEIEAMTTSGGQRLYTFVQRDPGEPSRVFAGFVDEEQFPTTQRRRAAH
jgi:hypothetical protein